MYVPKPNIRNDLERFWALPDRVIFGNGACHILAGMYLQTPPLTGFHAEKITPVDRFSGNHVYMTDGEIAFDYHGYSASERLLEHFRKGWSQKYPGWDCTIERVDYDLLSTVDLNSRGMRGPDQYFLDPIPRARRYLEKINHEKAFAKVRYL